MSSSRVLTETVEDSRAVVARCVGPIAFDTEGAAYVDISGSAHTNCLAHHQVDLASVVARLGESGLVPASARAFANRAEVALAERVIETSGFPGRVFFTSGGTEAVETALRLAFSLGSTRGRNPSIVLGTEYSYHGMSVAARNVGRHPTHGVLPKALDLKWAKLSLPPCATDGADKVDRAIANFYNLVDEIGAEQIAAVIIEPVAGTTAGARVAHPRFLKELRQAADDLGFVFIADEVITAFWRAGAALESAHLMPDMIVGGKCLGAGFAPLGCVIVSDRVCGEFQTVGVRLPLRLTFAGSMLPCAVGLDVQIAVNEIVTNGRYERTASTLAEKLRSAVTQAPRELELHGKGFLWGLHLLLGDGPEGHALRRAHEVAKRSHIVFMGGELSRADGRRSLHVLVTPAFDLSESELDQVVDAAMHIVTHV